MKKLLKWAGGVVALLIVVGIGLVIAANVLFDRKRQRVVKVDVKPISVGTDAASLERGKYLFMSRGCGDCHAPNGAGRAFIDEPGGGFYVRSPNITPGGVVAKYTELDWVRAIRHGVNPQGRALFVMPSEDYNRFTDGDVAALVAYARTTQQTALAHVRELALERPGEHVELDPATRRNLEITSTLNGDQGPTLLSLLDTCVTPAGSRRMGGLP